MVLYLTSRYKSGVTQGENASCAVRYLQQLKRLNIGEDYCIYTGVPDYWVQALENRFRLPEEYLGIEEAEDSTSLVIKVNKKNSWLIQRVLKNFSFQRIETDDRIKKQAGFSEELMRSGKVYDFEKERDRRRIGNLSIRR